VTAKFCFQLLSEVVVIVGIIGLFFARTHELRWHGLFLALCGGVMFLVAGAVL
jgi:hypothetical protein